MNGKVEINFYGRVGGKAGRFVFDNPWMRRQMQNTFKRHIANLATLGVPYELTWS